MLSASCSSSALVAVRAALLASLLSALHLGSVERLWVLLEDVLCVVDGALHDARHRLLELAQHLVALLAGGMCAAAKLGCDTRRPRQLALLMSYRKKDSAILSSSGASSESSDSAVAKLSEPDPQP